MSHVADQIDYLAVEAEWRSEWARLMGPMTLRAGSLRGHYNGKGNVECYKAIYEDTLRLRADLDELKERQTSILDKLKENKDAWHDAVSTRSGKLEELDAQVATQETNMSSNKETITLLKKKREELEALVKACQDELSWAQNLLKITQDRELALRKTYKDDARSSLSDREQKLKEDSLELQRQVEHASDEQQLRQNKLQEQNVRLEERRLALLEAEEVVKTTKATNDDLANHLKNARSILQRLANDVGSDVDTVSTLVDLEVLATSISSRFLNLQNSYDETEKFLADRVRHSSEMEKKLASTARQLKDLTISSRDLTKQLNASALEISRKDLDNDELQEEFREKERALEGQIEQRMILTEQVEQLRIELEREKKEFDGQVKDLKNYIAYKKQDAETAKSQLAYLGESFSISNTGNESLRTHLEELVKERDDQAEQMSGLLTNIIPGLQTAEQKSTDRADRLDAAIAQLRQHADKSAADAHRFRILYEGLTPDLDKAVKDCADRDDRIFTLSEEKVNLQVQLSTSVRHSGKLDRQIAKIEDECRTKEAAIQRLEASQSTASTEHQSARNELSVKDGEIADLTHRLGESRLQAATELADKDGQITELSRRLCESQINTERLEHALSGKDVQIKDLNAQVKEVQESQAAVVESSGLELTRRDDQITDLLARVDDLERVHAAETSRLTSTLTDKDGQIQDLNAQVEEIQESQAAEVEGSKIELTQRDDQIKDLTARLDGLEKARAADTSRLTTELADKDGQINALTAELRDLQRTSAARNDQRESELSSKVGLINDLNARMDDMQRTNTAELKQLKVESNEKDNQITELKRKEGVLRQDQDNSRNASRQKDSELADLWTQSEDLRTTLASKDEESVDLQEQLEELRTILTSKDQETADLQQQLEDLRATVTSKDYEFTDLREQFHDLQDAASSKDSDLEKVTQDLGQLRQTRSIEVRNLKSKASDDADIIHHLRGRLQRVQSLSETESMRLQQELDSQRVTTTDISQQVELHKRDLEKNERQMRQQEARISSLDREVAQLKKDKEDMGRDADSGMDHLDSERYEAEKRRDRAEEKLKDLEEELSEVQEWLEVSREEVRKLKARNASRRQAGINKQVLTGLQTRPSRDTSSDEEQEMLDEPVIPQPERKRARGQTDAPSNIGRKRKSADMASDEEETDTPEGNRRSTMSETTAHSEANVQQHSTTSRSATWSIDDMRNPAYVPDPPIPTAVLTKLREKMGEWDQTPRDWTKPVNMHRCVEVRVKKTKTEWPQGDGYRCGHCTKINGLCVVVDKLARVTMMPSYREPGRPSVDMDNVQYWMR